MLMIAALIKYLRSLATGIISEKASFYRWVGIQFKHIEGGPSRLVVVRCDEQDGNLGMLAAVDFNGCICCDGLVIRPFEPIWCGYEHG